MTGNLREISPSILLREAVLFTQFLSVLTCDQLRPASTRNPSPSALAESARIIAKELSTREDSLEIAFARAVARNPERRADLEFLALEFCHFAHRPATYKTPTQPPVFAPSVS